MFFSGAREDIVNPGREELPTGIYAGYTLTERVCQDDVFRYPRLSPVSLDAKSHGLYCRFLLHTTHEAPCVIVDNATRRILAGGVPREVEVDFEGRVDFALAVKLQASQG